MSLSQPVFILMDTSHAGNVGSAARAIKVMGFSRLVLVRPRFPHVLSHEDAVAMASGAADVLARARIVNTLEEALEGVHHLCATAMTPRDFGPPAVAPREHFQRLVAEPTPGPEATVGFLFGTERYGLSNDDVYKAHTCLSIPANPQYGSLNLAQAIQIVAYEFRQALGAYPVEPRTTPVQWADAQQVLGVVQHWQEALIQLGFLNPQAPKKLSPRLQQCLQRQSLTQEEVHILRGIARAIQQQCGPTPGHPTLGPCSND